ncbi:hypothetical protein F5148DRAFT_1147441 [Russula earlei]|uniref:Uncharacterized protein n=1 Tax=Russula earlei TaxID=71964 RepID=A0ACC0UG71_9AGAM|nr:hypothetical protein F5148DRAFT_1147441 [Russula earlei]
MQDSEGYCCPITLVNALCERFGFESSNRKMHMQKTGRMVESVPPEQEQRGARRSATAIMCLRSVALLDKKTTTTISATAPKKRPNSTRSACNQAQGFPTPTNTHKPTGSPFPAIRGIVGPAPAGYVGAGVWLWVPSVPRHSATYRDCGGGSGTGTSSCLRRSNANRTRVKLKHVFWFTSPHGTVPCPCHAMRRRPPPKASNWLYVPGPGSPRGASASPRGAALPAREKESVGAVRDWKGAGAAAVDHKADHSWTTHALYGYGSRCATTVHITPTGPGSSPTNQNTPPPLPNEVDAETATLPPPSHHQNKCLFDITITAATNPRAHVNAWTVGKKREGRQGRERPRRPWRLSLTYPATAIPPHLTSTSLEGSKKIVCVM